MPANNFLLITSVSTVIRQRDCKITWRQAATINIHALCLLPACCEIQWRK